MPEERLMVGKSPGRQWWSVWQSRHRVSGLEHNVDGEHGFPTRKETRVWWPVGPKSEGWRDTVLRLFVPTSVCWAFCYCRRDGLKCDVTWLEGYVMRRDHWSDCRQRLLERIAAVPHPAAKGHANSESTFLQYTITLFTKIYFSGEQIIVVFFLNSVLLLSSQVGTSDLGSFLIGRETGE